VKTGPIAAVLLEGRRDAPIKSWPEELMVQFRIKEERLLAESVLQLVIVVEQRLA
jgi:hypothetical protein